MSIASVYGVGTILEVPNTKQMVMGYRMIQDGERLSLAYLTVPYPLGFTSLKDVSLLSSKSDYRVICDGYVTEERQSVVRQLEKVAHAGSSIQVDEYSSAMDGLIKARFGG